MSQDELFPIETDRPISLNEQIAAVRREIALRAAFYPKAIKAGRMTIPDAEHQTKSMSAVLETLLKVKQNENA